MAIQFEPKQEQPQEEKTYKIGDTFMHVRCEPYIIARARANEVILTSLVSGNRFKNSIKVVDAESITESEFHVLTDEAPSDFTQRDFKLILI